MKKFLSILLAVAMVVSCISIVSFAEDAAKGVEISGEGKYAHMRTTGIGTDVQKAVSAVAGGNGNGKITVYAHNTGDKVVVLSVYFQDDWSTLAGSSSSKTTIAPGESAKFVVWFTVKDGKLMNGSAEQDMGKLTLRTDVANFKDAQGAKYVIWSPDISTELFKNMNATGRTVTEADIPALNIPDIKVVNGDAENGTIGWASFSAASGTVEQVQGGANGTDHAMKFVPSGNNKYDSIGFDLGAAIISDKENSYVGGGAGTYRIKFWAKAAEGKGGKFNFVLNSQYHTDDRSLKRDLTAEQYESIKDVSANTYINCTGITLDDKWQEFEIDVEVSEKFLTLINKLYNMGFANVYSLILRLDGSGGAFEKAQFDYLVDEVTIERLPDPTPGEDGGEETPKPEVKVARGFTVTYNEDTDGDHFINSKTGVLSPSEIKNGKITRKFIVKNNGKEDVQVRVKFEVTHTKSDNTQTWVGPSDSQYVDLPAGKQTEIGYTMDVDDNGKVTINAGGVKTDYDVSDFFIRLNLTQGVLPAGTSVTFYCDEATAKAFTDTPQVNFGNKAVIELTYASPANGGDLLPVAFIVIAIAASAALVVITKKRREF